MNHSISLFLLSAVLLIICINLSDETFLLRRHWHVISPVHVPVVIGQQQQTITETANRNTGSTWGITLLRYITEYKPELLPVLLDIAAENPGLLRTFIGGSGGGGSGISKRDVNSQVIYDGNRAEDMDDEISEPIVVRRMFDYVLENDSDDCFKKYICGLTKQMVRTDTTASQLMDYELMAEENESVSHRHMCSTKFAKCPFKSYKTADVVKKVMTDSTD